MVYCKKCGKNNSKGKFCSACGTGLIKKSTTKAYIIWSLVATITLLLVTEAIAFFQPTDAEKIFGDVKRGTMILMGIEFCGDNTCNSDELYICKRDCVWCGDGTCQNEEIGSCYDDCEWCGDGYCQKSESCDSCSKDCGQCKASAYCGDGICNVGECAIGCTKDCSFFQCENGLCEPLKGENCVTSPNDCRCAIDEQCDQESKRCKLVSCGNEVCDNGESFVSCPNDCKQGIFKDEAINPNIDYPIIFVHGHSVEIEKVSTFSINAFSEFQNELMSDGLYYDKGIILPNSELMAFNFGEWGRLDKPISIRTTYYIGTLDSSGTFIQSNEASRSINEYAERLGKVIDIVLHHTGKNKVIIVAHSMGGLVSRAYIKNYGRSNKVDKLITIGTPNHGIWSLDGWNWGYSASHEGLECEDMLYDSPFIDQLNQIQIISPVKVMTIAGLCGKSSKTDAEYDEVIRVSSVNLAGATNEVVKRNECVAGTDTFHGQLISPAKVPEVYNLVKGVI
mgnify:CR=1 FL=1